MSNTTSNTRKLRRRNSSISYEEIEEWDYEKELLREQAILQQEKQEGFML